MGRARRRRIPRRSWALVRRIHRRVQSQILDGLERQARCRRLRDLDDRVMTYSRNPTTAAISAALADGVHPWFRLVAENYIRHVTKNCRTHDDAARALDIGRSTWAEWRKRLG